MICKELDLFHGTDKYTQAGRKAEEQLAFYLRRTFGHLPEIRVFNNLRFEWDGDATQIDHLVVHPNGMIIVESKSVVGEVSINQNGEWTRSFSGQRRGIASPVLQAQRQRDFLKRYLQAHDELLLRKLLGLQVRFGSLRIDVLVAVSDSGIIHRKGDIPELCKADQVPDRVRLLVDKSRKANSLLSFNFKDVSLELGNDSIQRITSFFLDRHRPLVRVGEPSPASSMPAPMTAPPTRAVCCTPAAPPVPPAGAHTTGRATPLLPAPPDVAPPLAAVSTAAPPRTTSSDETPVRCKNCSGTDLRILHGKYGYYFKCGPCGANTSIRVACNSCGGRARLHKENLTFTVACESCTSNRLYFVNRS